MVPTPKEQLAHCHCGSSIPADISHSRFLLNPRRCFPRHHPYDEPSPCNQGLCRPRLRCAGQARAPCAALAPFPEGTTCHCAPTHILCPLTSGQSSSCSRAALQHLLAKPTTSTASACCQGARGDAHMKCQFLIYFSYKQEGWCFLSCQETKPVPLSAVHKLPKIQSYLSGNLPAELASYGSKHPTPGSQMASSRARQPTRTVQKQNNEHKNGERAGLGLSLQTP